MPIRYEQKILEKIMYYDTEGIMSSFPLYIFRLKEPVRRNALETAVRLAIRCHPRFGCRPAGPIFPFPFAGLCAILYGKVIESDFLRAVF